MDFLICIDGTGPSSVDEYTESFRNSHLNVLQRQWTGEKQYYRGPTLWGSETREIADNAYDKLMGMVYKRFQKQGNPGEIYLAGYSRGGCAVIYLAHRLQKSGIPVKGMILLDAVDRARDIDGSTVPGNVENVIHALRNPNANSRPYFGNCGLRYEGKAEKYRYRHFFGTHGAIGGVPWKKAGDDGYIDEVGFWKRVGAYAVSPTAAHLANVKPTKVTLAQDRRASKDVWHWMMSELKIVQAKPIIGVPIDIDKKLSNRRVA